jgi:hypothetical protein
MHQEQKSYLKKRGNKKKAPISVPEAGPQVGAAADAAERCAGLRVAAATGRARSSAARVGRGRCGTWSNTWRASSSVALARRRE